MRSPANPVQAVDHTLRRSPDASEQIADALLEYVVANRLPPGSRIPSERELAEQFGVSRTVVRQATRTLIGKGLLESRPGVGVAVVPVAPSSVVTSMRLYLLGGAVPYEWVHEIRMMIEVQIAGLAAERGTDEQVERARQIHAEMIAHQQRNDLEARSLADVEFHRQLAMMVGNDLFLLVLDSIGDILLEVRRATASRRELTEAAVGEHEAVLVAVEEHDPVGARKAMQLHLERAYEDWLDLGKPVDIPRR